MLFGIKLAESKRCHGLSEKAIVLAKNLRAMAGFVDEIAQTYEEKKARDYSKEPRGAAFALEARNLETCNLKISEQVNDCLSQLRSDGFLIHVGDPIIEVMQQIPIRYPVINERLSQEKQREARYWFVCSRAYGMLLYLRHIEKDLYELANLRFDEEGTRKFVSNREKMDALEQVVLEAMYLFFNAEKYKKACEKAKT